MSWFKKFGVNWKVEYGLNYQSPTGKSKYVDYETLIDLLHPKVNWTYEIDSGYQGEFFSCGQDKKGTWYFIQGSFGSCSGCDWLESLTTIEDAKKFLNHFKKVVIRRNTKERIIKYMRDTVKNVTWSEDTILKLIEKIKQTTSCEKK